MRLIESIPEMQAEVSRLRLAGRRIGFVPTMGYLHEGHLTLMRLARPRCDELVVSIFVNPTQFAPHEDYAEYPRDLQRDLELAESVGCDLVFHPTAEEMYPQPYYTYVVPEKVGDILEGASRPGFFRGVATVVTKLFHIVQPHLAVFGQKDAQQAFIIQRMVRDLNFDIEIVIGPIVREDDGLAVSSRNVYLSPQERRDATVLFRSLQKAEEMVAAGERSSEKIGQAMRQILESAASARIDYVSFNRTADLAAVDQIEGETLISLAVWIGKTRLIDNTVVTP
jgi:pantoate--beta-alanine ligase